MTTAIRFGRITDPTRTHQFFWAVAATDWDRFRACYDREEDLTIEPFEFTDPQITTETADWIDASTSEHGKSPAVMVGSIENGHWVNWNLTDLPVPPIPAN